ncbi:MAG: hypothetical protein VZR28_03655 [Candidatus Cryptobacteroides sp.]|nr:hypothetical protein [Candidatus Cryptobacteroides sp.]
MKNTEGVKLVTVGKLLKELKKIEKDCQEYILNVEIPDGSIMNVMSSGIDKDGDLSIEVDEDPDEGYYDVGMLIDELEVYEKNTKVYLEGCGLYLTFDQNPDESILYEPDDEEEIVACGAHAFGEYEYKPSGWFTEAEKREQTEAARKNTRKERIGTIALAAMTTVVFIGLCYNAYALVIHSTRHAVWENITGVVLCVFLLVICGGTLFYSKHKE